ncbi:Ribonuclease P protein subunit p30 [Phytophthora cinnamomi]|uniref:Ribonuclease P protein subunit p30 n=1 Tax=Phytophthora cinnamomi TaxID=4785 RepID=UPI00355A796D|nr:Ribonuclease P protein subunit p30 [Phytophthora cinnamomi]
MVYVDLNVRATARVSAGELQRLGYATVCVNVDCEGGEKPKPATALPELPQSAQKDKGKPTKKAKFYTAALGNGLQLKDAGKKELPRQRKRITLKLEEVADAQKLLGSDVVQGYDVIAAEAATPKVFQFLCEQADIDLITFDVTNRLPFQIKRPLIAAAIKRDIHFEITYTPCLGDTAGRRYFFSNASNLVRLTGGKNLVFSSGATRDILLRSPYDVLNVGLLSGLKYGQALDAISTSCLAVLEHADKRRGITGGVQVEATEDVAME